MWSLLVGIYMVCLGVGFIYVLISVIMGEIGAHADFSGVDHGGFDVGHSDIGGIDATGADVGDVAGGSADVGHIGDLGHDGELGAQHLPMFSPLIIASFLASFGGMGLLGRLLFGLGDLGSLLFAFPTAVALAVIIFLLVAKLLFASAASSEATLRDILGAQAEVITSIPENGTGEIAYVCKGFRYTAPAQSYDGRPIERGTRVRIVKSDGRIMTIKEF